jgi:hypothetical protein
VKYGFEWTPGLVLLGAVLVLPLVPHFALIGLVVVALAAVAALVALAGAILADAVPARAQPPPAPRSAVPVNRRLGTDRRRYHTRRRRHQPLGPDRPPRTNDSKEITVNPPAAVAPVETPHEAVDELIARVLRRAHGTMEALNARTRRSRSSRSLIVR